MVSHKNVSNKNSFNSWPDISFGCCKIDDGGVPLDHTMTQYLRHKHGFFIESGANNGVDQSNTLIFAKYGNGKVY